MGEDGKVIYKVVINDDGVESAAEAAGQKAGDGVEKGAERGVSAFEGIMTGAAHRIGEAFVELASKGVDSLVNIGQAGVEFNAKMETYQTAFTTLLGDAEEADRVMSQIREDAASTPFDVDSLTAANQALISAGVDADKARGDVLNLANAIAATGGGSAELSRMAGNMQQIRNTGKATAQDIRQFANAGINIYGLLADSMGVTTEEAAEMDVTYDQLAEAFAKAAEEGGVYEDALEKQSQTFTGRISTLKDNATQLAGALTEDIFSQLSGNALPMVMDWVAELLNAAETDGVSGAISTAGNILSNLVQSFMDGLPEMVATGISMLSSLIDGIAGQIPTIITTAAHILAELIGAIAEHLPELLESGINLALQIIAGLLQSIPDLVLAAGELIVALFNAFFGTDWGSIGKSIVDGLWAGITGAWTWLTDSVSGLLGDLWQGAKDFLGIKSPSKKFKYVGEMSVEGSIEGFEDREAEMLRTVRNVYSNVNDAAIDALRPVDFDNTFGADRIERDLSFNLSATGGSVNRQIVVPVEIDGREVARATAWDMGEMMAWEEM